MDTQTEAVIVKEMPTKADVKEFVSVPVQTVKFKKVTRTVGIQFGLTLAQQVIKDAVVSSYVQTEAANLVDREAQATVETATSDAAVQIEQASRSDAQT